MAAHPEHRGGGEWEARRAGRLLPFVRMLCRKIPWISVPLAGLTLLVGDDLGPVVFGGMSLILWGIGHWLRRDQTKIGIAIWVIASLFIGCFVGLLVFGGGGNEAPAMFILPILGPFLVFLLGGRAAVRVVFLCCLSPIGYLMLGDTPLTVPIEGLALGVLRSLGPVASTLLMTLLALAFEQSSEEQANLTRAASAAAERSGRAKSAFLSTMSHELRTPLGVVVGTGHLLQKTVLSVANARRVELLVRSGQQLLRLVDDILDLARLEAGKVTVERIPFALSELMTGLQRSVEGEIDPNKVHFRMDQRGPDRILGDPRRIRQMVEKLLDNAVKFTHEGDIHLQVSVVPAAPSDERAVLSDDIGRASIGEWDHWLEIGVGDTGVGIPKEGREAIFESFVQIEQGQDRRYGGGGMGLSLVAHLVECLGGELQLESQVGVGTRVTVFLPVKCGEPISEVEAAERPRTPVRVLVAEDNRVNQMVIQAQLETLGFEVVCVETGLRAVEVAQSDDFSLVLMDEHMPEMGGADAARALRAAGFRAPIVAFTASTDGSLGETAGEAGMDAQLTKPARIEELKALFGRFGLRGPMGD